jgi:hypothetical protein
LFASGTIQEWAVDKDEIDVKPTGTEDNQWNKDKTELATIKEDNDSHNEGKANNLDEDYVCVLKRHDDSDQHSGDNKEQS